MLKKSSRGLNKSIVSMQKAYTSVEKTVQKTPPRLKTGLSLLATVIFWISWPFFAVYTGKHYNSLKNVIEDSVNVTVADSVKDTVASGIPITVAIISGLLLIMISFIKFIYYLLKHNGNKDNSQYAGLAGDWFFILVITIMFMIAVVFGTSLLKIVHGAYDFGLIYFTSLGKDEDPDWYIAIVMVSILILSLVMLARFRWWAATFFIGVAVSLFILIAPRILGDPDGVGDWVAANRLLILTISMASGVALPFIVMGTDQKISDWGMRTNVKICQKAAVRALVVPGLIFTFVSTSEIIPVNEPTHAPTNSTNGEQTHNHDFTNNAIVLADKSININYEEIIQ